MKKGFADSDVFIATYCDQFLDHFIIDFGVLYQMTNPPSPAVGLIR